MDHVLDTINGIQIQLGQVIKWQKIMLKTFSTIFFLLFYLELVLPQGCSKRFRQDHKIDFQNTFCTKSINIIIDSISHSIHLRSIG